VRPLNLASQPFHNERLPVLALAAAGLAVLALTLQHAWLLRELLPGRTSAARQEVAALEAKSVLLRSEARAPRVARPEAAKVAEWGLIKDLVDRRAFSWTLLFAQLESVLPDGVHLVSIAPNPRKGELLLDVAAVTRSPEDAREFVRRLEGREEFDDVYLREEGERGDVRFTMKYRPTPTRAASAPGAPGGGTADDAEPGALP
jgi:hypothetical protein